METIKIAELAIDNKKLLSELQSTKKSIEELSASQKQLKQAGDTTSKSFIENEAKLKSLKQEYNGQIKVLQATTGANQKLTTELGKEIRSVDEAKRNNAELVKVRNQLNDSTTEGANAIAEINEKMDANNAKINEGSSSLEKQFQNIGNYPDVLDSVTGGLGSVVSGLGSMTKAALGFIATPIGALLALLVGAFALVKNAMDRSEESTNKIRKAFSAFQGITNTLMKFLEPLGEFLIDGLVKGFELAEKAVYKGLDAIASGLALLGFDEQAKQLRNFNKEVQEGAANAKILADAEAQLTKSQRESQKIQLEYQRDAEKLRQIRDNENLSIQERIKANDELGTVLQTQLEEELKIAQLALEVANLRIESEGQTSDALDEQAEALTTIADIQERITGQESEQLTNRVALQKEAADKAKEAADEAIALQNDQLEKFIAQQGIRAKTLEEQLKIDEQVANKRIEILDAELKNRNITQEKYDAEYLNIQNELALSKANLAVENAKIELDSYIQNNLSKLDNEKFFSDESLRIETERLQGIVDKQKEFAQIQLDEGVINRTEYNAAIQAIDDEFRIQNEENELARKEAQKEADAIDLENRLILEEELYQNAFELESARLEQQRLQEVEAAEKTGADITLINEKYAQQQKYIEQELSDAKLKTVGDTLGQVTELLSESTAAGKAAGIAQATINTYQGVSEVWRAPSVLPEPLGTAQKVISTGVVLGSGLAAVKKITGIKLPKAERGMLLSGARHSEGGIPIEAEDGEVIINRKSSAKYLSLLSKINQDGGGIPLMARGGIAGSISSPSTNIIDYDLLAISLANTPAPVVSVEEISSVANRVNVIESQASF